MLDAENVRCSLPCGKDLSLAWVMTHIIAVQENLSSCTRLRENAGMFFSICPYYINSLLIFVLYWYLKVKVAAAFTKTNYVKHKYTQTHEPTHIQTHAFINEGHEFNSHFAVSEVNKCLCFF